MGASSYVRPSGSLVVLTHPTSSNGREFQDRLHIVALSVANPVGSQHHLLRSARGSDETTMKASDVPRAVAAGMATGATLDLRVDEAVVLHDSNRLAVRLLPCDVLARVAPVAHHAGAAFEVEVARRLAETESPVAELEPRAEPCVYLRDGFVVTLWTYYQPVPPRDIAPAHYARALERLHAGMRQINVIAPHFTD